MKYKLKGSQNPDIIQRIFENRNINAEQRHKFLKPVLENIQNPRIYKNMESAVRLYLAHVKNGSKILVVVDSDCDGYCSNAAFVNYTKEVLNHNNIVYIMHEDKRHGFTRSIMEQILEIRPDLVVMIDAGSNDYEEHEILYNTEIPVIILDHHECEKESKYALVVNNQLCEDGNKTLSGGGMVMKFMELVDQLTGKNAAEKYMDLVAVSLVADSMLMTEEETRYYVLEGLNNIKNPMLKVFAEEITDKNFNSISYNIAPSINSIIRVGDMEHKVNLFDALLGSNRTEMIKLRGQGEVEMSLVDYIIKIASRLKSKQNRIIKRVLEDENTTIITDNLPITFMFHNDEEALSLSGLIASKVAEMYDKPALVLRKKDDSFYHGSARSIDSIPNFKDILENTSKFDFCQGHQGAFGVKIFINKFNELLMDLTNTKFKTEETIYEVDAAYVDGVVSAMDIIAVDELKNHWCRGFEKPLFYIKLSDISSREVVTMGAAGNSVKIHKNYISFVKFKCSEEELDELLKHKNFDMEIIGTFNLNEWNGRTMPQVIIEDFKVTKRTNELELDWDDFNAFGGFCA
ncbi:DHH family phosphoesterase [Terrisporobacter sp.]|uniref:DHH family phosphoesterase n=1 Tax=Terrisporobacter sp. TaxID=1965305 RepID=UPI0039948BF5